MNSSLCQELVRILTTAHTSADYVVCGIFEADTGGSTAYTQAALVSRRCIQDALHLLGVSSAESGPSPGPAESDSAVNPVGSEDVHSEPEGQTVAPGWSRARPWARRRTGAPRAQATRAALPHASPVRALQQGLQRATGASPTEVRKMMALNTLTRGRRHGRRRRQRRRRRR